MQIVLAVLALIGLLVSCGQGKVAPRVAYGQAGIASWYGEPFHGRRTANGDVYDMYRLTAAHKTAPLGIEAIVTNLDNGRSVRVRINDRGPFVDDRILDLSYAAARELQMVEAGLARVSIEFLPGTVPAPVFVVQAGAFTQERNAKQVQQALAPYYPRTWIVLAREGDQQFFRVWLGKFPSRAKAAQAVRRVRSLGYAARIVPLSALPASLKQSANRL